MNQDQRNLALRTNTFGMSLLIPGFFIGISTTIFDVPNYYTTLYIILLVLGITIGMVIPMIITVADYYGGIHA